MPHKITIRNTDHVFTAEEKASVLKAGLLEGLNLDHNCANGSCGECKARLVEGQLESLRHHDYRLSDQEKEDQVFLMCCHRAKSDLLIETHESETAADIPHQEIKAKVGKLEVLQEGVMQFQLRTPRSKGLHFLAGQGVNLSFKGQPPFHLDIASCPCDSIQLRFHLRRRDECDFSTYVFDKMKKNAEVMVSGPVGEFTLNEQSERPIIFIAWECGFAPIASLIDHVIQKDEDREIHFYWLSAISQGHYLSNYCRAWVDALDNFHYHSIDLAPYGEESFDSVFETISKEHTELVAWDIYMNCPEHQVEEMRAKVLALGVPDSQLKMSAVDYG